MDDLRWILLLVGGLVIVAVYFSSRFEREDWVREREQFDAQKQTLKKASKKSSNKSAVKTKSVSHQQTIKKEPPVAQQPRIEPQMTSPESVVEKAGGIDVSTAPIKQAGNKKDDAPIVLGSPSRAVEEEKKNSKLEPDLSFSSAAVPEVQESLPTSAEEKIASEPNEVDDQEMVTTSSASEIPAEVILTEEPAERESQEKKPENAEEMPGLSIRAGIEDEITRVEIPADLAIAEAELRKELHAESQQRETPKLDSVEKVLPPNVEPLVLVLTIMAEDESFTGPAVQEALEAEGLQHGDMRIFHCFDDGFENESEDALPVFSVASLVEPGYFELDKIDDMEMPGLTLFSQLPGPLPGEDALNIMLDKGRGIAVRLHGQLCDEKRNRFTTQAKTHYQDRIANFTRELGVARKKADV